MKQIPQENEIYAHYKHGVLYRVLRVVPHGHKNAFKESIVVYQNITTLEIWYRELSDFNGTGVDSDGDTYEVFKLIGSVNSKEELKHYE